MDKKVRELLDRMPERAPRSKLEPHADVIRELRKKRRTYLEIAAFFRTHLELPVAPSTLHDFVKTRARQARSRAALSPELPAVESSKWKAESPAAEPEITPSGNEVLDRIRALKARPLSTEKEPARFEFDPQEPLTLKTEKSVKKGK